MLQLKIKATELTGLVYRELLDVQRNALKMAQKKRPLLSIRDSFRKMIIVGGSAPSYRAHDGILIISLRDFLLWRERVGRLLVF